jgi:hypothetical protein
MSTLGERFAVTTSDGRISWMRVTCSGFRPAPPG